MGEFACIIESVTVSGIDWETQAGVLSLEETITSDESSKCLFVTETLFGRVDAGFEIAGADIRDAADQIGESYCFDIRIRIRKSDKNDWEHDD